MHLLRILMLLTVTVGAGGLSARVEFVGASAWAQPPSSSAAELAAARAESLLAEVKAAGKDRDLALKLTEQAVEAARDAENPLFLARVLDSLGRQVQRFRDFPTAIAIHREAATLAESAGDLGLATRQNLRAAALLVEIGKLAEGLELLDAARQRAEAAEHPEPLAEILYNLARTHQRLGNLEQALAYCEDIEALDAEVGLALRARSRGRLVQARVLHNMGHLKRSLRILDALEPDADSLGGNWPGLALNARANVLLDLGDLQSSRERYERAKTLAIQTEDPLRVAIAEGNIAGCHMRAGRYQDAIDAYGRCAEVFEKMGHAANLALTHLNLANAQLRVGDSDSALLEAERARTMFTEAGVRTRAISALLTVADIQFERGKVEEARSLLLQGREQAEAEGIERDLLRALFTLANLDAQSGDHAAARASLRTILQRTEATGELLQRSRAFSVLGEIALAEGELDSAQIHLGRAVDLAAKLGSPRYEVIPRVDLGRCLRAQGQTDQALEQFAAAIEHVEKIRWGTGAEAERWSVFGQNLDPYAEMALSLIEKGAAAEAFAMVEMSRARTLLDHLSQLRIDLDTRIPPELRSERNEILARTSFVRSQSMEAEGEVRDEFLAELDQLDRRYERVEGQIHQIQSPFSELRQFEPATSEQIDRQLGPRGILLEYAFLDDRGFCFTVAPGQELQVRELPVDLPERVQELRSLFEQGLQPRHIDLNRAAELQHGLYLDLIAPSLGSTMPQTLVIAADGPLWSLPFEALLMKPATGPVSATSLTDLPYLFREIDLHSVPSSTVWLRLAAQTRARSDRPLLVLADPDYSHAATGSASRGRGADAELRGGDFTRLPHTAEEAQRIAALLGEDRVQLRLGSQATEDGLKAEHLASYAGLHFAAHSHVDELHPQRTAVVLSLDSDPAEDGLLTLREIYDLDLDAELVVLSTCSSAEGRQLRGEGVIALVRPFLAVGAREALVSLWPVQDRSTAEFMVEFHRAWGSGLPAVEAARAARLALLQSPRPAWRLPFHWAPFIVVGGP